MQDAGLPVPEIEYQFLQKRKFRFDFAWPNIKVAVEVEGGTWSGGRHVTGPGFETDCVKYNLAACNGWRVLRVTNKMIESEELIALKYIIRVLEVNDDQSEYDGSSQLGIKRNIPHTRSRKKQGSTG
jgi:hypothetical protein